MNVLGQIAGSFDRDQARFTRIKDILSNNPEEANAMETEDAQIDKDEAKFIQLHLENSCPKYHMYFGDYSTEMFQKLGTNMWYEEYKQDDIIFK